MLEVRQSAIHGNGVFATQNIAAGTHICDYLGEIIDKKTMLARQKMRGNAENFVMAIDDERFIDATNFVDGNPARFINHSCDENCEVRWNAAAGTMEIFAIREILAGTELSFDYGFELSLAFPCKCGARNCCGYIVAKPLRGELLKLLAKRRRLARLRERDFSVKCEE